MARAAVAGHGRAVFALTYLTSAWTGDLRYPDPDPVPLPGSDMGRTKLTNKQKMEIALDMLGGKMSHASICRKWGISRTCASKIRDQALEVFLREMERSSKDLNSLREGVEDVKKLVRDHSFVVSYLKKKMKS